MDTPTMTIDGVEYVEAPETAGCRGCAFYAKPECRTADAISVDVFGADCVDRDVIYIKARSES